MQISLFDGGKKFINTKPIRLIESLKIRLSLAKEELLEWVQDSDSLKDEIGRLKKVNRILVERELKMREERDNAEEVESEIHSKS